MQKNVAVLVPRRAGIADRDRLWAFAQTWWINDFPDWQIVEGVHEFGPFNRSAAINDAARKAGDWDVAVIIDGDVLADKNAVIAAVDLASSSNRMVLGFTERVHLNERGTQKVLSGYRGDWKVPSMITRTFHDSCSSLVVVSRGLWDIVGGFDEKFVGWGWEDVGFRIACETFGEGPMAKIGSTLWHLHHRVSHENNRRELTFQANRARGDRYKEFHYDPEGLRRFLDSDEMDNPFLVDDELIPTRIPRILHRTVPEQSSQQSEDWWEHWRQLLPGWELMTHRDPLNPDEWPETSDLWPLCKNGAQLAGLIRLEALWRWGGVYVDSDVEPYRSLEPLLHLQGFAAWEDRRVVPDAVLGAEPQHPAVKIMLHKARVSIEGGEDAWASGPGVTTATLPYRRDWLLLPPGSFYPYLYTEKDKRRHADHATEQPWSFAAHHWDGSWLTPEQRAHIAKQARSKPRQTRR